MDNNRIASESNTAQARPRATKPGLKLSTAEQQAESQAWLRETVKPPDTIAMNVGVAANLPAPMAFIFNARIYRVPNIPYPLGIQLQELYIQLAKQGSNQDEETVAQLHELQALCDQAAALFPALCEPKNWFVRMLWRRGWLRNPFLSATSSELAHLLGFFLQCRMKSSVQLLESSAHRPALASSTRRTS